MGFARTCSVALVGVEGVVVEAELRSGSLITARRALALGRPAMGVPGSVSSSLSAGVHQLLRGPTLRRGLLAPEAAQLLEALPARGALRTAAVACAAAFGRDCALARLREPRILGFVEHNGDY